MYLNGANMTMHNHEQLLEQFPDDGAIILHTDSTMWNSRVPSGTDHFGLAHTHTQMHQHKHEHEPEVVMVAWNRTSECK